jgi:hypothetical protein
MAATVYKLDILGSTLTQGIFAGRFDRAIRRARITGLDNLGWDADGQDLKDAIQAILDLEEADPPIDILSHPQVLGSSLPLLAVRARKVGSTQADLELIYGRLRWSLPQGNAAEIGTFITDVEAVPVYGSGVFFQEPEVFVVSPHGLPGGDIMLADGESPTPRQGMWPMPVLRIGIPTVLGTNPVTDAEVLSLVGKVNDGIIRFNSVQLPGTIPVGSMRYDGVGIVWRWENGGNQYETQYQFTYRRDGWWKQVLTAAAPGYVDVPMYEKASFNNAFPVH